VSTHSPTLPQPSEYQWFSWLAIPSSGSCSPSVFLCHENHCQARKLLTHGIPARKVGLVDCVMLLSSPSVLLETRWLFRVQLMTEDGKWNCEVSSNIYPEVSGSVILKSSVDVLLILQLAKRSMTRNRKNSISLKSYLKWPYVVPLRIWLSIASCSGPSLQPPGLASSFCVVTNGCLYAGGFSEDLLIKWSPWLISEKGGVLASPHTQGYLPASPDPLYELERGTFSSVRGSSAGDWASVPFVPLAWCWMRTAHPDKASLLLTVNFSWLEVLFYVEMCPYLSLMVSLVSHGALNVLMS
jgi:hypothetical protein